MCIVCDTMKAAGASAGQEQQEDGRARLFDQIMGMVSPALLKAGSAQAIERNKLDVDPEAAYTVFAAGVTSGVHASAELMAQPLGMQQDVIIATRALVRSLAKAELIENQRNALTALQGVLAIIARAQVDTTLRFMAKQAEASGIERGVAEGRAGIDSMIDEQFIAIAERSLHQDDSARRALAKMIIGGATPENLIRHGRMMVQTHIAAYAAMQQFSASFIAGESEDFINAVREMGL